MRTTKISDGHIMREILIGMVTNKEALAAIAEMWPKDGKPFGKDAKWANIVGRLCIEHLRHNQQAPHREIETLVLEFSKSKDEGLVNLLNKFVGDLSEQYERNGTSQPPKYYIDLAEKLFFKVELESAMAEAKSFSDDGDMAGAAKVLTRLETPRRRAMSKPMWFEDFERQHPDEELPHIYGLARVGEVVNIVSTTKSHKSWLTYTLAYAVMTGTKWLNTFDTAQGRVLFIDNELSAGVLAERIRKVGEALTGPPPQRSLRIWAMRGEHSGFDRVEAELNRIKPGKYRMVICDAKYLMGDLSKSENDNNAETAFYKKLIALAKRLEVTIVVIHHASKGNQADKRTTDIGAGAGSQSRMADCHVVLREHEEKRCAVFDVEQRSFKPVEAFGLRFQYPLWVRDDALDVEKVKGRLSRGEEALNRRDAESDRKILKLCKQWRSRRELKTRTGWGDTRVDRAIARLTEQELLETENQQRKGNSCEVFRTKRTGE